MRVEYKFGKRELFYPVVLVLRDKELKKFLYFLILAFNLAIAFRIVGSDESDFNAKAFVKCSHISGYKLRSVV